VGLTATPERPDGAPILDWFDGRIAAELRLWDAIDRGLLVPFQYFAVHDVVSIESVRFPPGGRLDPRQLGELYTGHHARAHLAVEAIRQHVENPLTMRALVFCASVEHARFMAEAFEKAGLTAACVTGSTPKVDRDQAVAGLRNGTVRALCAVDVFNEGVDIPELGTVLFLRPTESAIVFQQQLGRGLRRAPGKRCLTVLDFVSQADHRFRYDIRYRALLVGRTLHRPPREQPSWPTEDCASGSTPSYQVNRRLSRSA
jgi:superfamily II DNA or RNA helicase